MEANLFFNHIETIEYYYEAMKKEEYINYTQSQSESEHYAENAWLRHAEYNQEHQEYSW